MALTKNETQVQWSGSDSVTLNSSSEFVSDAVAFDDTDVAAVLQVSVDNQGTAASGDVVTVRILYTSGDVLGDSGADYDTSEHSEQFQLDTVAANTPGEDPARKTISLNDMIAAGGFKLSVSCPNAATRNIVVRARLKAQRAS